MNYLFLIPFYLIALIHRAQCIAFQGPLPTVSAPEKLLQGFTPKPTTVVAFEDLKRRYLGSTVGPDVCGWVNGRLDSQIECPLGTCMLFTPKGTVGMAGCCTGSDYDRCGWATGCIAYTNLARSCDSSCSLDTYIRKCTNAMYPYCNSWTYPGDNIKDYGCGTEDLGWQTMRKDVTDSYYDITTSIRLPYAPESSVASWKAAAGSNGSGKKGLSVALLSGIIVGGLILIAAVITVLIICCFKQRNKRRLAAALAAQSGSTHALVATSSSVPPPIPQPMPVQQPLVAQAQPPPPMQSGYFTTPVKYDSNLQTYPASPISQPSTPAPAYSSPYQPPSMQPVYPHPVPSPVTQTPQYYAPHNGAMEVEAITSPRRENKNGPIYEIGHER